MAEKKKWRKKTYYLYYSDIKERHRTQEMVQHHGEAPSRDKQFQSLFFFFQLCRCSFHLCSTKASSVVVVHMQKAPIIFLVKKKLAPY